MDNKQGFDTLLMIGIVKALKEQGYLSEEELNECIKQIESEKLKC